MSASQEKLTRAEGDLEKEKSRRRSLEAAKKTLEVDKNCLEEDKLELARELNTSKNSLDVVLKEVSTLKGKEVEARRAAVEEYKSSRECHEEKVAYSLPLYDKILAEVKRKI